MWKSRIIIGAIFFILFFLGIYLKPVLLIIIFGGGLVSTWEYLSLLKRKAITPFIIWGVLFNLLLFIDAYRFGWAHLLPLLVLCFIGTCTIQVLTYSTRNSLFQTSTTLFSILYVGIPMGIPLWLLSSFPQNGIHYIVFTALVPWAADTGAYIVGSNFGRHPFFPNISPRKTLEGAIGGLLTAPLTALLFYFLWPTYQELFTLPSILILSILFGIFGQLGDLVESTFKRDAGVKDISNLIPGHGGIVDVIDSLLLCFPVLYLYLRLFST